MSTDNNPFISTNYILGFVIIYLKFPRGPGTGGIQLNHLFDFNEPSYWFTGFTANIGLPFKLKLIASNENDEFCWLKSLQNVLCAFWCILCHIIWQIDFDTVFIWILPLNEKYLHNFYWIFNMFHSFCAVFFLSLSVYVSLSVGGDHQKVI